MIDKLVGSLVMIITFLLFICLVYMALGFFFSFKSMRGGRETDFDKSRKFTRIGAGGAAILLSSLLVILTVYSVFEENNVSLGKWLPTLCFSAGIGALMLSAKKTKMHQFKGGKFRTRMIYFLLFSIFFVISLFWKFLGNADIVLKAFILSVILSASLYMYARKWIAKHLNGTIIVYEKRPRSRNSLRMIFAMFLGLFMFIGFTHKGWSNNFLEASWSLIILILCFSWIITQLCILFYVITLEKKLGASILEDEK